VWNRSALGCQTRERLLSSNREPIRVYAILPAPRRDHPRQALYASTDNFVAFSSQQHDVAARASSNWPQADSFLAGRLDQIFRIFLQTPTTSLRFSGSSGADYRSSESSSRRAPVMASPMMDDWYGHLPPPQPKSSNYAAIEIQFARGLTIFSAHQYGKIPNRQKGWPIIHELDLPHILVRGPDPDDSLAMRSLRRPMAATNLVKLMRPTRRRQICSFPCGLAR